jgi:DNA invertase Pin-like site-specific DNA recombinase
VVVDLRDRLRVVGYARVSKDETYNSGGGIAAQRAAIVVACRERAWKLLEVVEDVGFSGRDMRRPGMQATLLMLDSGQANCLVAARIDRLSRSLLDFALLSARARQRGWSLMTLDLMVDTTTPAGEAMASLVATFAQYERRLIGARIVEAQAQLRAESRVYSPYTPLGFRREGHMLVRDETQQRIVARARRMYAETGNLSQVARWLNGRGLRSATGLPWDGQAVKRMLRQNQLIGCPTDRTPPEVPVRKINPVPYGYRFKSGRFTVDRNEQRGIQRIRALRDQGFGMRQIAAILTDEGVPTKRAAGRWDKTTVGRILNGLGPLRVEAASQTGQPLDHPQPRQRVLVTPAPYGYRSHIYKLVPDQSEQRTIRRMRRLRAAGASYPQIARKLDALGVTPPRADYWRGSTIRSILINEPAARAKARSPRE